MLIKIGDFAKMNALSVQSLRYYEKVGVLKPAYVDEGTGYRYYEVGQSVLVDAIVHLRSLNYSLADIRSFLSTSGQEFEAIMQQRQCQLLEERQCLEAQIHAMQAYIDSYHCYELHKETQQFCIETIPSRYAYQSAIDGSIYTMDDHEYELALRQFKKKVVKSKIRNIYFNRIGTLIRHADFSRKHFFSNQMFIFVPQYLANMMLPHGDYAITYVYEFDGEKRALKPFYDEIVRRGYRVNGDYYCEVVMEKPYLNQEQRSMFIRMQVPVTKTMAESP